ncbi:MAG: hypothetical protein ACYCYI_09200 [Saccharofermentanales bacterium]
MKILGVILIIPGLILSIIPFMVPKGGSLFFGLILIIIGGVLLFKKAKE